MIYIYILYIILYMICCNEPARCGHFEVQTDPLFEPTFGWEFHGIPISWIQLQRAVPADGSPTGTLGLNFRHQALAKSQFEQAVTAQISTT